MKFVLLFFALFRFWKFVDQFFNDLLLDVYIKTQIADESENLKITLFFIWNILKHLHRCIIRMCNILLHIPNA